MITIKVQDLEDLATLCAELAKQGVTAKVIKTGGYWFVEITGF